jgi:hypothetical protein
MLWMTYTLAVELPAGWKSVSQGERTSGETPGSPAGASERWSVATPTEEVHRLPRPFTEYSRCRRGEGVCLPAQARSGVGRSLLDATAQYLEMYRGLLGPYPYSKFALVENFWETGYGMPSFTLLGEQVIRFPFILHSSYRMSCCITGGATAYSSTLRVATGEGFDRLSCRPPHR